MQTAEVVIIGGGIVGSSIAYHLIAAGCKDVLVIERESAQGKGSTGKSMGGVRAQFSTPINIQMSLYSIPFYASFDVRLGHPAGYRPQGYLFCATNDEHLAYLRTNFEKQVAMGLKDVRLVNAGEMVFNARRPDVDGTWTHSAAGNTTVLHPLCLRRRARSTSLNRNGKYSSIGTAPLIAARRNRRQDAGG